MPETRDPFEALDRFDPASLAGPSLPAAEVRRRGDRLRRRRAASAVLGAAAAVALIAGGGVALTGGGGDRTPPPAEGPTSTVSPTPSEDPTDDPTRGSGPATGIPEDFPIAANLGDPVDVTDTATLVEALAYCGDAPLRSVSPREALGAYHGGGETYESRNLILFDDAATAREAERTLLDAAAACPNDRSPELVREVLPASPEWPGRTVLATFPGESGGTAADIHHVVRRGPALLLSASYRSPGDVQRTRDDLTPLVEAMDAFGPPPAGQGADPSGGGGDDIPADFPLDAGALDLTGDGGEVRGPSPELPSLKGELVCAALWTTPPTDRLGFSSTGPEYADRRELVTFASAGDALAQMAELRSSLGGCDRGARAGEAFRVTTYPQETGHDTVTLAWTFEEHLGGSVLQVTRVGRAVLVLVREGEWSPDTAPAGAEELTAVTREVAPALCAFTADGC